MSSEMSTQTSFGTFASWTVGVLVLGPDPNTSETTTYVMLRIWSSSPLRVRRSSRDWASASVLRSTVTLTISSSCSREPIFSPSFGNRRQIQEQGKEKFKASTEGRIGTYLGGRFQECKALPLAGAPSRATECSTPLPQASTSGARRPPTRRLTRPSAPLPKPLGTS